MESTDSSSGSQQPNLPPGFRFHPTDEELVVHYLKRKATSAPLPVSIIAEVDLYKFDPWELPAKAAFGEQEWYFFSPRDRKYPNGVRPNRAATSGYWKATGTDKPVLAAGGTQKVGVKKALVFYGGKPPKGIKTNWIMHEYRLPDNKPCNRPPGCDFGNKKNSLRLDDWVLCRIYKKNNTSRQTDSERDDGMDDMMFSQVPPSLSSAGKFGVVPRNSGVNFSTFLDTDPNLLEGIMNHVSNGNNNSSSIGLGLGSSTGLKRALQGPYWAEEREQEAELGSAPKRFHGDGDYTNGSLGSLLSQIPAGGQQQTPPLVTQPQASALGSLSDGMFRTPYPLSGPNWYA